MVAAEVSVPCKALRHGRLPPTSWFFALRYIGSSQTKQRWGRKRTTAARRMLPVEAADMAPLPQLRCTILTIYEMTTFMITSAALWAKLKRNPVGQVIAWHSLVDHSSDVAAVVEALLLQPTIRRRMATAGGRTELDEITLARLGALALLHDIGKANRGFRARVNQEAPPIGHIDQLAWVFFGDELAGRVRERLVDVLGLERLFSWCPEGAEGLFHAVFAHHGRSRCPLELPPHRCLSG
jgi:CRISPR-associated endonuclease Cas3-HD